MPNMKTLSCRIKKVVANIKVFQKVVKGHVQSRTLNISGAVRKGLVIRNTFVRYENPISQDKKKLWPM